jgi:hypothetical protein
MESQEKETTKIRDTVLGSSLREMCQALKDEVTAAQKDPSRAFEVTEGQWLYGSDDGHLYTFKADIALPIPPETPIRLIMEEEEAIEGVLVALQDFDVFLQLRRNIGATVPRGKISSEPWFIYESLYRKLEGELDESAQDINIPMGLLGMETLPTKEDAFAAERGEQIIRELEIPSLLPNECQRASLRRCAGSQIHFVWGPPGTGVHTTIHEQKMGVKLGDTFWGMCTLINPLDWSQNSTAILQAASRADLSN